MDFDSRLDALVLPLRADVVSGAAVVARLGADVMRRAAERIEAEHVEDFRTSLAMVGMNVLEAQPAMAPLVSLVRDILQALADIDDLDSARLTARRAADEFRESLESKAELVASRAAPLLPAEGDILTLSSSSTVRSTLLHRAHERRGRVVVLESRPMQEGQLLASALAQESIPVLFAVDAAVATLVPDCTLVLLGADSVGDLGVVNKLGSLAAAHAADRAGVPVVVVTDETKILPPGFAQAVTDDRPAEEVWRGCGGVKIWNRYFEVVPLDLVTVVVTETGALTPDELARHRSRISVPEVLRAWAHRRPPSTPRPDS
jgi:translation initiation factor 2B subunit (eIF-2B alpha/beta/delta family)